MKDLLTQFFANRTTPLQRRKIDLWLQKEENKIVYFQWLEEWENRNPEYTPDMEKHLAKFSEFMGEHKPVLRAHRGEGTLGPSKNKYLRFLVAAAALLVFVGMGWALKEDVLYRRYRTAYGEMKTVALADGSVATLNGNSFLQAPRWNFTSHREVYLKGEASFSVRSSAKGKYFKVKTGNQFEVKVMGTEFSVLAREKRSRVHLTRGKVEVDYLENKEAKKLTMKKGDVVTFSHGKASPTVVHVGREDEMSMLWRQNHFAFNATTLDEIAGMLYDTYGFTVKMSHPSLGGQKLAGSYTAGNVEDLLQAISEMMDIKIEREGDNLIFKPHHGFETGVKRIKNF